MLLFFVGVQKILDLQLWIGYGCPIWYSFLREKSIEDFSSGTGSVIVAGHICVYYSVKMNVQQIKINTLVWHKLQSKHKDSKSYKYNLVQEKRIVTRKLALELFAIS